LYKIYKAQGKCKKMTNRLFNVQIELHKNFKKVVFLLSIFLFVACGAGGGSQGRIINKIQANAEGGDPHAQYLMGTYYFNGIKDSFGKQVYPQNKERAKEFFDKAMSSGDKTAQKNVSQFLATEELSTQLNISNSMAQNFVVVYGVTTLKEYESAVSEIKSLGYPVKNVTSITPTEVIFYLDFKKNAIQKNISLPKAVQDLKKDQDAKVLPDIEIGGIPCPFKSTKDMVVFDCVYKRKGAGSYLVGFSLDTETSRRLNRKLLIIRDENIKWMRRFGITAADLNPARYPGQYYIWPTALNELDKLKALVKDFVDDWNSQSIEYRNQFNVNKMNTVYSVDLNPEYFKHEIFLVVHVDAKSNKIKHIFDNRSDSVKNTIGDLYELREKKK